MRTIPATSATGAELLFYFHRISTGESTRRLHAQTDTRVGLQSRGSSHVHMWFDAGLYIKSRTEMRVLLGTYLDVTVKECGSSSSIACFACSAMKQRLYRLDVVTINHQKIV